MDDVMPDPGTQEQCSFCRVWVTLRPAESGQYNGWYFWTADYEPVDGQKRCYGAVTPRAESWNRLTFHKPAPTEKGIRVRRAVRYDPHGLPQKG